MFVWTLRSTRGRCAPSIVLYWSFQFVIIEKKSSNIQNVKDKNTNDVWKFSLLASDGPNHRLIIPRKAHIQRYIL